MQSHSHLSSRLTAKHRRQQRHKTSAGNTKVDAVTQKLFELAVRDGREIKIMDAIPMELRQASRGDPHAIKKREDDRILCQSHHHLSTHTSSCKILKYDLEAHHIIHDAYRPYDAMYFKILRAYHF